MINRHVVRAAWLGAGRDDDPLRLHSPAIATRRENLDFVLANQFAAPMGHLDLIGLELLRHVADMGIDHTAHAVHQFVQARRALGPIGMVVSQSFLVAAKYLGRLAKRLSRNCPAMLADPADAPILFNHQHSTPGLGRLDRRLLAGRTRAYDHEVVPVFSVLGAHLMVSTKRNTSGAVSRMAARSSG